MNDDTKRLNWMISNSAKICHANDDEFCWVEYSMFCHEIGPRIKLGPFNDPREAIDAAMKVTVETDVL